MMKICIRPCRNRSNTNKADYLNKHFSDSVHENYAQLSNKAKLDCDPDSIITLYWHHKFIDIDIIVTNFANEHATHPKGRKRDT